MKNELFDLYKTLLSLTKKIEGIKEDEKRLKENFEKYFVAITTDVDFDLISVEVALKSLLEEIEKTHLKKKVMKIEDVYSKNISDYGLSARLKNCLKMCDIDTLGDLCSLSSSTELCRVRSKGKLTAKEADDLLKAHGLTWGDDTWVRSRGYKFVYNKNRFVKHEEKKVLH